MHGLINQTQFRVSLIDVLLQNENFQTTQSFRFLNQSCSDLHPCLRFMGNDWKSVFPNASGRDGIFAKSPRCDTSRQSAQLWNSQSPECRTTSPPNREIPARLVRPCVQNVPGETGDASPAGYTHGKAAQRSSKDQVEWQHFRPCFWVCCWPWDISSDRLLPTPSSQGEKRIWKSANEQLRRPASSQIAVNVAMVAVERRGQSWIGGK